MMKPCSPSRNGIDADTVFARLDGTSDSNSIGLVEAMRSCGGFGNISDNKSLENLLRSRVMGKVITVSNMSSAESVKRTKKSVSRSPSATELARAGHPSVSHLSDLSRLKYESLSLLHEMWQSYASGALSIIDSTDPLHVPVGVAVAEFKHSLLTLNFELVGAILMVVDSSNSQWVGKHGLVVREGENSLDLVSESNKHIKLAKSCISFSVLTPVRRLVFFGPDLCGIGRSGTLGNASESHKLRRQRNSLQYI